MKSAKFFNLLVLGLVLTVAVVGCRKKPGYITPLPGMSGGQNRANNNLGPGSAGVFDPIPSPFNIGENPDGTFNTSTLDSFEGRPADREIFSAYTVYFDFDSSTVRPGEISKVQAVADHLKANPGHALLVEGHCDERGTEEYNRALGERRALAMRESLARMGVEPDRIRTLSYGEDRPAVQGSGESVWSQNRRGEFVLLLPRQ